MRRAGRLPWEFGQGGALLAAHPMRYHHFLESHLEADRLEFVGHVIDRFLGLRGTAQARANVIRQMRHLTVGVVARQGGLLQFFQVRQRLR